MAFAKKLTARGVDGSYIRPVAWRIDDNTQELSVLFALYVDRAHSDRCKPSVPQGQRDRPLLDVVAKLRVYGDRYEAAFGQAARVAAAQAGVDIDAMIYDAAKAACQDRKRTGVEDPQAHVISDFGGDVFADARAV